MRFTPFSFTLLFAYSVLTHTVHQTMEQQEAPTAAQVAEYETQLEEVQQLLNDAPNDESLRSLKRDLEELLAITRKTIDKADDGSNKKKPTATPSALEKALEAAVGVVTKDNSSSQMKEVQHDGSSQNAKPANADEPHNPEETETAKKKSTKVKDFEVPSHLIALVSTPLFLSLSLVFSPSSYTLRNSSIFLALIVCQDTDTDAEKNRKHRALKALKSKWRAKKKEAESEKKQKSWQSFQKKRKIKDKSMFSTSDGDAPVGVVSVGGRLMTEGKERKRHKHL